MQIGTNIEATAGRYRVELVTLKFTALEDQKIQEFGEPVIDAGSTISGSASRPNQTNTTATITPVSGGSGATVSVSVDPTGAINNVQVLTGGSGYSGGATIAFAGDGSGATASVQVTGGVVTGVTVITGGTGYHNVPYSVSFVLPPALRRLRSDFPVVKVFDTADTPDADVMARVYADTIISRLTAAINTLKTQTSPFEGEFVTTV
jgi:hypothetical protein